MLIIKAINISQVEERRDAIVYPDVVFENEYTDEWLNSAYARTIITDSDHLRLSPLKDTQRQLWDNWGMRATDLCTTTKCLLLAKYLTDSRRILLSRMAPRCFVHLLRLSLERDIYAYATDYVSFNEFAPEQFMIHFEDLDTVATTKKELSKAMFRLMSLGVWS